MFQNIGHVYSVLSNPKLRDIYDKTGSVASEDLAGFSDRDWDQYFREMFPKLTKQAIKEFQKKYKGRRSDCNPQLTALILKTSLIAGSAEELEDLKEAYKVAKGNMGEILETVILAAVDDEERFRGLLLPLIEADELPSYKQFLKEDPKKAKSRRTRAEREAKEAEEHAKELGLEKLENDSALTALIQKRSANNFDALISRLEEKYKNDGKGKRKGKTAAAAEAEDDDEEDERPAPKKTRKTGPAGGATEAAGDKAKPKKQGSGRKERE